MDSCFAVCFLADSLFIFGDQILLACTAQNTLTLLCIVHLINLKYSHKHTQAKGVLAIVEMHLG